MIHLYEGNGKGKSTAACGLAIRAVGSGMKVLYAQFFKDGTSSEIRVLSSFPNVDVMIPKVFYGRFKNMSEEQKKTTAEHYDRLLSSIIGRSAEYDLIVLDEVVSAYRYEFIEREKLLSFLKKEGTQREIALTGRDPAEELIALADYVTEMRKEKHPFDCGIIARKGIEY